MKIRNFIFILAAVSILATSATAPAEARSRKKVKATVTSQTSQPKRISLVLDLAELRDSINKASAEIDREVLQELADSDRVAYDNLIAHLNRATRMRSIYDASSGSYLGDLVVGMAYEHLGKPYVWAAEGPDSFDCSGFVRYVYKQVGVNLPRTSREQFLTGSAVNNIPDLRKGDLVFFSGRRGTIGSTIGHVGIVVDVDFDRGVFHFIHANSSKKGVSVSRNDEKYFLLHYQGARRIIPLDK